MAVSSQLGDLSAVRVALQYYSYDSDITCSFPANGHYTEDQRTVYDAVLSAQQAVIAAMKPGVSWPVRNTPAADLACPGLCCVTAGHLVISCNSSGMVERMHMDLSTLTEGAGRQGSLCGTPALASRGVPQLLLSK